MRGGGRRIRLAIPRVVAGAGGIAARSSFSLAATCVRYVPSGAVGAVTRPAMLAGPLIQPGNVPVAICAAPAGLPRRE